MNIAYIDHSFHKKTQSTRFLFHLLEKKHTVTPYWDESWNGGSPVKLKSLLHHDAIVCFQILPASLRNMGKQHPNITFVPMLDSYGMTARQGNDIQPLFQNLYNIKFLNFSKSLHYFCQGSGLCSKYVQYWQKPAAQRPPAALSGLHGFFWCRRPSQINWLTIRKLIGKNRFDSLHLHMVPDPGEPGPVLPGPEEQALHHITISDGWFASKQDYETLLSKANVFFAPRVEEGIGQAMLEAFCRGQCVVAPDCGTMNEYIYPQYNGILYDPNDPQEIDLNNIAILCENAFQSAAYGYSQWEKNSEAIEKFITTPTHELYTWRQRSFPRRLTTFIAHHSLIYPFYKKIKRII